MSPNLSSRSLRGAIIKAILTVYLDIMLAYIVVAGALVMCPPATKPGLKSEVFHFNVEYHMTFLELVAYGY